MKKILVSLYLIMVAVLLNGCGTSWINTTAKQDRIIDTFTGDIKTMETITSDELKDNLVKNWGFDPGKLFIAPGVYFLGSNGKYHSFQEHEYQCSPFAKEGLLPIRTVKEYAEHAIKNTDPGYAFGYILAEKDGKPYVYNIFVNYKGEPWVYDPEICSYPGHTVGHISKIVFGYLTEASL